MYTWPRYTVNYPLKIFLTGPQVVITSWGFNLHHEWEHFWHTGAASGEMVGPWGGMDIGGGFGYWPYADISAVNYFIETLPKYAANFTARQN